MKSVLIIDSSEIIATLFSEIFQRRGWKAIACEEEAAFRRLVSIEHYDVVILGDGVTSANVVRLIKFIRALEHRMTTAVVMVTGCAEISDQAIAAGADEVLPKPINAYSLACAVDKHVA